KHATTIQVKTNLKPKPGGGKGKAAIDWWLPDTSPAELIAFVNLASETVWILTFEEVQRYAQQHSSNRYHLYMYTDPAASPRKADRLAYVYEFESLRLENRVKKVFGK
ncbi:MAG TPA: hypothetical protein VJ983_08455, partial [candidate division Zixibacteria bacterium]|nr:hypothetical protein [candidate division Zixibacteria bacterium]